MGNVWRDVHRNQKFFKTVSAAHVITSLRSKGKGAFAIWVKANETSKQTTTKKATCLSDSFLGFAVRIQQSWGCLEALMGHIFCVWSKSLKSKCYISQTHWHLKKTPAQVYWKPSEIYPYRGLHNLNKTCRKLVSSSHEKRYTNTTSRDRAVCFLKRPWGGCFF